MVLSLASYFPSPLKADIFSYPLYFRFVDLAVRYSILGTTTWFIPFNRSLQAASDLAANIVYALVKKDDQEEFSAGLCVVFRLLRLRAFLYFYSNFFLFIVAYILFYLELLSYGGSKNQV